ncbi:hypothetical protein [Phenylobacterium sp.]|jgi:hypothetical protein|uniref:hypothetical protein n=1 Tax=Phenylobacterium sp. TaxID=1871053 RepID=UPI002F92A2F3
MRIVAAALALLLAAPAAAADYKAPRNAYGQPDLGGVWNTNAVLPLEASPDAPNLVATEAEAKTLARKWALEAANFPSFVIDGEVADLAEQTAQAGLAIVKGQRRTRQVVQPADGRLPMTPRGRAMLRTVENVIRTASEPPIPSDHPEQRRNWERCIVGQGQPPILILNEINPRQILQTRDAVVLLTEYGPDLRIIPLTDTHGPKVFTGPMGDAIARWEGETLVIETIRLPGADTVRPLPTLLVPPSAVVEERYTRVAEDEILYQYTVRDPALYAGPWLAEYSLYRQARPIYEFACHEGNYSLPNILSGARARDRERAAAR